MSIIELAVGVVLGIGTLVVVAYILLEPWDRPEDPARRDRRGDE